jgi:hypothetical protein
MPRALDRISPVLTTPAINATRCRLQYYIFCDKRWFQDVGKPTLLPGFIAVSLTPAITLKEQISS